MNISSQSKMDGGLIAQVRNEVEICDMCGFEDADLDENHICHNCSLTGDRDYVR